MTQWVFHIGYQKCASTWLQRNVFPRLAEVNFLGKRAEASDTGAPKVDPTVFQCLYRALVVHPFDFDADGLRVLIAEHESDQRDHAVTLVSAENLVGTPWQGGIDGPMRLERLARHFKDAKILLVIRHQVDALGSFYKQHLLEGGTCTVESLCGPRSLYVDFRLDFLNYHRMAAFCAELVGRERVCVLPYELIGTEGHQAFCDRICAFMGVPRVNLSEDDVRLVRTGYDPNLAHYARYANFFLRSNFNPCGPVSLSSIPGRALWALARGVARVERALGRRRGILSPKLVEEMTERFRPSNRALRDYCPVDVGELGYPV